MDKTVLIYLKQDSKVLFMHRNKKKNDLNHDKWIGIGGHIEKGETKEQAVRREVLEETGLTLNGEQYRGEILFINNDYQEIMYLFTSNDFIGELIECDEGELHWIEQNQVSKLNVWEGDKLFLDKLLNTEKTIKMSLRYNEDKLIDVIDESEE